MGGEILVTSVYGKGSTFTAVLPQKILDSRPIAGNLSACENQTPEQPDSIVQFTAPDARILIVDDISVNLLVAEGLLAPYKMQIECCTSGAGSISLAEKNYYDLILMDHLMPGMDGIEAAAKIRASKSVNPQVPIIALTANAIMGMKEMFLENGFNDYLSKPIEIATMNAIIKKWVPKEKQINTGLDTVQKSEAENSGFEIPGLDTVNGIRMTGGTETGYRQVLTAFYKDARERLTWFDHEDAAKNINTFTAHIHALKSAAATIGGAELSKEAADLETAGNTGDLAAIREGLPNFTQHLTEMVTEISKALEKVQKGQSVSAAELLLLFEELRGALEKKDMETAERIIAELGKKNLDEKTREAVEKISDLILVTEFGTAIQLISVLLEANNF
jgi:CheY-like chemotaxis protein